MTDVQKLAAAILLLIAFTAGTLAAIVFRFVRFGW